MFHIKSKEPSFTYFSEEYKARDSNTNSTPHERRWNLDEGALDPTTSKTCEISDSSKLAVPLSLHVCDNKSCAALECLIARDVVAGYPRRCFPRRGRAGGNFALKSLSVKMEIALSLAPPDVSRGGYAWRRRGLGWTPSKLRSSTIRTSRTILNVTASDVNEKTNRRNCADNTDNTMPMIPYDLKKEKRQNAFYIVARLFV